MQEIKKEKIEAGEEVDVLLMPFGTFPQVKKDGTRVDQVCDEEAAEQLVRSFDGDVLVDADHTSENSGSTEASAWITRLWVTDEGCMATFKFTDKGAESVTQRRYRFVSPAWVLDDGGRPEKLMSCALTNTPNLPVEPILNKAVPYQVTNNNQGNPMERIKELLGLSPEATEEEVIGAFEAILAKIAELEESKVEAEAEEFAAENADKADEECLKNAYKKDPDLARMIVENIRAVERKPVCNCRTAQTPKEITKAVDHKAVMAALPPSARAAYFAEHSADI